MKYNNNDIVTGIVTGIENYGIFVELEKDYTGLIHISEISTGFVKNINKIAKIGDTITAKIIEIDENEKRVKLSMKSMETTIKKTRNRERIIENENGFQPLKDNLDKWIDEKVKEIKKK